MSGDAQWSNGLTSVVRVVYGLLDRVQASGWQRSARVLSILAKTLTGVEIEPGARLGPGFVIRHGQGIVVGRGVVTGSHCVLLHQVTLGVKDGGYPTLGDRVVVHAGAKVLGPIRIGDDAVIGANAVVIADVPPGCSAVGVPARILRPSTS